MTTANIIMAVCLIALMGLAISFIIRYARKNDEIESREAAAASKEKSNNKRHNELDRWAGELQAQAKLQADWDAKRKHIYANVSVGIDDENKPDMKAISKSLSSKIGYALRREFPVINIKETHDGRTVYSVDFYVTPYED